MKSMLHFFKLLSFYLCDYAEAVGKTTSSSTPRFQQALVCNEWTAMEFVLPCRDAKTMVPFSKNQGFPSAAWRH